METNPLHTKVDKLIQTRRGTVVLESSNGFPRGESNLYCISTDEKVIWAAEKPDPRIRSAATPVNWIWERERF